MATWFATFRTNGGLTRFRVRRSNQRETAHTCRGFKSVRYAHESRGRGGVLRQQASQDASQASFAWNHKVCGRAPPLPSRVDVVGTTHTWQGRTASTFPDRSRTRYLPVDEQRSPPAPPSDTPPSLLSSPEKKNGSRTKSMGMSMSMSMSGGKRLIHGRFRRCRLG